MIKTVVYLNDEGTHYNVGDVVEIQLKTPIKDSNITSYIGRIHDINKSPIEGSDTRVSLDVSAQYNSHLVMIPVSLMLSIKHIEV